MKITALVIGILWLLLSGVVLIVSLILPAMTRNVSKSEASLGVGIALISGFFAFIMTLVSAIVLIATKKKGDGAKEN